MPYSIMMCFPFRTDRQIWFEREMTLNKGSPYWSHGNWVTPQWHIFHQNQRSPLFPQNITLSLTGLSSSSFVSLLQSYSVLFCVFVSVWIYLVVKWEELVYSSVFKMCLYFQNKFYWSEDLYSHITAFAIRRITPCKYAHMCTDTAVLAQTLCVDQA